MQFLGFAFFIGGIFCLALGWVLVRLAWDVWTSRDQSLNVLVAASPSFKDVLYGKFNPEKKDLVSQSLEYGLAHDARTGELLHDEGRYSAHTVDAIHVRF